MENETEVINEEVIEQQDTTEQVEAVEQAEDNNETEQQEVSQERTEQEHQNSVQKTINKKHFEAMQAKRERDEALARIQELERAQQQAQAKQFEEIPPIPDPFEDNYEQKLQERDQIIAQKAAYDAQVQQQQYVSNQAQQQAQFEQQQKIQQDLANYKANADKNGIDAESLQAAGNVVAQYGVSDDLTLAILGDSDGALITTYLADNPQELSNIAQMPPVQAAMYIERSVRPNIKKLKPKQSSAPAPSKNVYNTATSTSSENSAIKGAVFE